MKLQFHNYYFFFHSIQTISFMKPIIHCETELSIQQYNDNKKPISLNIINISWFFYLRF